MPYDYDERSVSLTLHYALDDWCIANLASSIGEQDIALKILIKST